ncbi:hypothetical protein FBU31_001911 [Coemansia sp. 'formosensis']|nr:hypothetical protein FBU31_001911 [Coemansia sp. 'formosensis']
METTETKHYVVLLETNDKMDDTPQAHWHWTKSAKDYLKTQGIVIPNGSIIKSLVIRSKTFLLFGHGVYWFGDGDDYFDDDTEIIVLNMKGGNWSVVTDKHKLAHRRARIMDSHVRIKGRPLIVGSCGKCDHVRPRFRGPCTENCQCCPPHVPKAPTPLEDE